MSRIPTRTDGGERAFDLTLRLSYRALDGWEPVASVHDYDDSSYEPTQDECVRSQVLEAIPGVLPDERGDEAATLVECEVRDLGWCSCGAGIGVNASKCVDCTDALKREIYRLGSMPALSLEDVDELLEMIGCDGEYQIDYECLPRLRELRTALADAMERYEGEGGDA